MNENIYDLLSRVLNYHNLGRDATVEDCVKHMVIGDFVNMIIEAQRDE